MNYVQLLEDVKYEVTRFFQAHEQAGLSYHNLSHTEGVVSHAGEIARHYQLDDKEFFIVTTAAWFHDIGYYLGSAEGHEMKGVELAENFLRSKGLEEETITAIRNCILATRMPQSPSNLLEQIVCDADLFHLGTDAFFEQNKKMRKEMEWRLGKKISKHDWRHNTVSLLEPHQFKTDYGRDLLQAKMKQNLEMLKLKEGDNETLSSFLPASANNHEPEIIQAKKEKSDRPDRGVETMFRVSSANHQRLSDMADNKSHIMITTTSIIISVLLSVLLRKLEDNPHLIIPTLLLLTVCVVTMVFSILATRPSLPGGTFTQKDIDEKKVNLLFFGNFYKMNYDDYYNGMKVMMNDREFLYGSLTRDVYSQGIVLGKKYRLLRIAYSVFMFGIVASVLAFIIAVIVNGR